MECRCFWTPAFSESWWVARNFPVTIPKSCISCHTEISTFQTSQLQSIRHKVEEDDGVGMKGKGGVGGWGSGEAGAPPTSHLRNHLTPSNFPILANLITAILDMLRPPGACLEHISVIHKIGALETHWHLLETSLGCPVWHFVTTLLLAGHKIWGLP